MKVIVVGCGISGIVAANVLAERGHRVEIFETRPHLGGNCYDEKVDGIDVHKYGAHIFHTNDAEVWRYLNRFTRFNGYTHRVRAHTSEGLLPIPYSRKTEQALGRRLDDREIRELIFRRYSERHWGVAWDELPSSITKRLPVRRSDFDDRYFTDNYQGIPEDGYTAMLSNMLDGIKVHLAVPGEAWRSAAADLVIYTGKIDAYFNYRWGRLPYRSLRFERENAPFDALYSFEEGAVINECTDRPYNRTVDCAAFHPRKPVRTILVRDYPEAHDETNEPMYPMSFGEGQRRYREHYQKAAAAQKGVAFVGRLATYKYLDMWMAVKQALRLAQST